MKAYPVRVLEGHFVSEAEFVRKNDYPLATSMSPILVLEELNGNDSDHHFDSVAAGCFADVAIQQRLGILPERRTRVGPGNYHHPCPHGAILSKLEGT